MRNGWLLAVAFLGAACGASNVASQNSSGNAHRCECGAHPPAPPQDRAVSPYAGEPQDLSPFAKFASPYDLNYIHPNIYAGAGRDLPEPKGLTEVRIGFFGPVAPNPEAVFGQRMRVALKAEIPIVNSASTDPTIPETYIPWYFTDLQDDRVQSYTLARRIFTELGLKRVALLRAR